MTVPMSNDPVEISLTVVDSGHGSHLITLTPPAGVGRVPVDICCVIDISGSMSSAAIVKTRDDNGDEQIEDNGLFILDIVKHALRTIISSMTDVDRLSLVSFSNNARVEIPLRKMDDAGKLHANQVVTRLSTEGCTNLWDGLSKGLDILRESQEQRRVRSIFLLTDGMPNVEPPRGSVAMLKNYFDANPMSCSVNTFGFGCGLDSDMLKKLSIVGNGQYAFIPDAGMLGTVFIHAMSNTLVTCASRVRLSIQVRDPDYQVLGFDPENIIRTDWGFDVNIGSIQYGQPRHVLVLTSSDRDRDRDVDQAAISAQVEYLAWDQAELTTVHDVEEFVNVDEDSANEHNEKNRCILVDTLRKCMSNPGTAQAEIDSAISTMVAHNDRDKDIILDMSGQGKSAFVPAYFSRWGRHYIPSLYGAHQAEQCNNFKDLGVQHYGGTLFKGIRDSLDTLFNTLPAMVPSRQRYDRRTQSYSYSSTPVASRGYNNSSDPCFHGDCWVGMLNGEKKLVSEISKGDILDNGATVVCVLKTSVKDGRTHLCKFPSGLVITAYHPMQDSGEWKFPKDIVEPEQVSCDHVYSFLLDKVHTISVNGTRCICLGHDEKEEILAHDFFGSQKVVEAMKKMDGFSSGVVISNGVKRDAKTGRVNGFM